MFTGIVQTLGTLVEARPTAAGQRFWIDRGPWQPEHARAVVVGDSICCSGVCLTVADLDGTRLAFDVVGETLARTNLGSLKPGAKLNLEPSVTPLQPMGGHFLQGHVDAVGRVDHIREDRSDWRLTIRLVYADGTSEAESIGFDPADTLVPKGSVAVDGVSLTIAEAPMAPAGEPGAFTVALIPVTLEATTLGGLRPGDAVNLETDVLARTVLRCLRRHGSGR